ncbi:MAG: DUF4301 family protein [Bacteroidales bacterium]|jgi:hypothetical protein|nr:DUF4301 family protein [Bacteroidales bacterium]
MSIFNPQDMTFMAQRGSNPEMVEQQFAFFNAGFDFANIRRNVSIGNGIVRFSKPELEYWIEIYTALSKDKEIVKFVPASGAATRMFKDLYEALQSETDNEKAKLYKERIKDFAFFDDLKKIIEKKGYTFDETVKDSASKILIKELLNEGGMNYGNLPKGLLKFHKYKDENRTALEEHLVESARYAQSKNGVCKIHFTVSENHLEEFVELTSEVKDKYEKRFGITFQISYSNQSLSTDTLAAELNHTPFRDKNGKLLFRPGGHGALINNLNNITADLVFVKNIDNVVPETQLEPTILYKKALAGYLLHLQEKNFEYQNQLIINHFNNNDLQKIIEFTKNELMIQFEEENPTPETVLKKLNRPMRICGVVKNEGEPGGGPFWVINRKGETSLQIVESSQIDKNDPEQKSFLASASHFNPVDLVCCYKDVNGNPFNLNDFIDPYTGFISEKSYEGRKLLAMELPGLWNGSMADWITIFAEVPLSTFNPVKTVFDLLKRV